MIDPKEIVDLLNCVRLTPNRQFSFIKRPCEPAKDPYTFMAEIGYTRDEAISCIIKKLTSQECIPPFRRENDHPEKHPCHVWVFRRYQSLRENDESKEIPIYIKLAIEREDYVTVISFHEEKKF